MWISEEGGEDTMETMGQKGAAKRADSNDTRVPEATRRRRAQRRKSMEDPRNRLAPSNQQAQIAIGLDSNRDEGKLRKKTDLGGGGKTANFNPAGSKYLVGCRVAPGRPRRRAGATQGQTGAAEGTPHIASTYSVQES